MHPLDSDAPGVHESASISVGETTMNFHSALASATASQPIPTTSAGDVFALTAPHSPTQMRVTKRNGSSEVVDLGKIVRAVSRNAENLFAVDPMRVALRRSAASTMAQARANSMSCRSARPPR